jgi:hypothetical protein
MGTWSFLDARMLHFIGSCRLSNEEQIAELVVRLNEFSLMPHSNLTRTRRSEFNATSLLDTVIRNRNKL